MAQMCSAIPPIPVPGLPLLQPKTLWEPSLFAQMLAAGGRPTRQVTSVYTAATRAWVEGERIEVSDRGQRLPDDDPAAAAPRGGRGARPVKTWR